MSYWLNVKFVFSSKKHSVSSRIIFLAYCNEFLVLTLHCIPLFLYLKMSLVLSFIRWLLISRISRKSAADGGAPVTDPPSSRALSPLQWFFSPCDVHFQFNAVGFHSALHLLDTSTKQVPVFFLGGKAVGA